MIVGVDEAGRGAWAGPLVVVAVNAPEVLLDGLTDSKALSKKKRILLARSIRYSCDVGIGWADNKFIDRYGLSQATRYAAKQAIESLRGNFNSVIIDGVVNFSHLEYAKTIPKADTLVPQVSAASIVAKTMRDNYMAAMAKIYPDYGYISHVGYGTKVHQEALANYGITPLHRRSYKPLRQYI